MSEAKIQNVNVLRGGILSVSLTNNKNILIPKNITSRLSKASEEDFKKFRVLPDGVGIHWEGIDEDISIEPFLSKAVVNKVSITNTTSTRAGLKTTRRKVSRRTNVLFK